MDRFALVVEDEAGMAKTLKSLFATLGDRYEIAGCLEEARTRFKEGGIDYILLDLKIPADEEGDFPDVENAMTFLREIRGDPAGVSIPVFPMTSYGREGFALMTDLMALGVQACLAKPFESPAKTAATIDKALKRPAPAAQSSSKLEKFSADTREMIIHEDQITLCGVTVWTQRAHQDVRDALAMLSRKDKDGFVRIKGAELDRDLGRNASNPISGSLDRFCKNVSTVMKRECGLECKRYDVLDSRSGGYHFTRWLSVQVVGEWAVELGLVAEEDVIEEQAPRVNERQQWVLDQIDVGRKLKQKDVLAHFDRDCNASTVKRDLKGLREAGLIKTGKGGFFVRCEEE